MKDNYIFISRCSYSFFCICFLRVLTSLHWYIIIQEIGKVMHECESELVCKLSYPDTKIPYFNAGIYLENKKKIGKIDEIFGPLNLVMFTVKMDPGIVAKSFQEKDSVYIGTDKLLPLTRFTSPGGEFNYGTLVTFLDLC